MASGIERCARSGRKGERRRALTGRATAHRRLGDRMRSGWVALLLAVTVSLSWQSLLSQTHQHPASTFAPIAAKLLGDKASANHPDGKSTDQPADCPICRQIAQAGHYLSPAPVSFSPPIVAPLAVAVVPTPSIVLARRSHAWQSRAPPSLLQA